MQSRYYDPQVGRFINADALVSTGQGILGNNMFAYCRNNPVRRIDISGAKDLDCCDTDSHDDNLIHEESFSTGSEQSNKCRNPYGRNGGPDHQGKVKEIGNDLESRGYDVKYVYRVETPDGAKRYRYLDVYAEKDGDMVGVQVGRMTKGGYPVSRERAALNDIRNNGYHAVFIAYNNW